MSLSPEDLQNLEKVVALLRECEAILFITGAGISADSGLPTYRGIGGLYEDKAAKEGLPIESLLSGSMLAKKPELTWKYLLEIERACRGAKYNRAHKVIAEMESHFSRVCVFTQNVDGFHKQAGSKNVIDIHGDLHFLSCTKCKYKTTVEDYSGLTLPPRCPLCDAIIRPDVVLFGEMLPSRQSHDLVHELQQGFDLVFSIGTSSLFPYISGPLKSAKYAGIPTIEINPGVSSISEIVDIKISGGAAETLDAIWKKYLEVK